KDILRITVQWMTFVESEVTVK
ncbi:hypothetical protein A2U01_0045563, partial [Trifolium medium]|nr:hypothetical protein [Trifolium medium]